MSAIKRTTRSTKSTERSIKSCGSSISTLSGWSGIAISTISTQRRENRKEFAKLYADLCFHKHVHPLQAVKQHLEKGVLDILCDRIKLDEWNPIISALSWDQTLRVIAIRLRKRAKSAIDDADSDVKARSVTSQPVVTTKFVLYWLVEALRQCLYQTPVLTVLELEGLPLKGDCIRSLAEGLAKSKILERLSLFKSGIGDEGADLICTALREIVSLKSLDLSFCDLTEQGAIGIVRLLTHQKLDRYSEVWKQSLRYRDPDVEDMSGLRRLTLNNNPELGDTGVQLISNELTDDLWIRGFDIQDTGLTETGGTQLLQLVMNNPNIVIVDARSNANMPEHILDSIMSALAANNSKRDDEDEYKWITRVEMSKMKPNNGKTIRFYPVGNPPPSFCITGAFPPKQLRRQCSTLTQKEASSRGISHYAEGKELEYMQRKLKELTELLNRGMVQRRQVFEENQILTEKLRKSEEHNKFLQNEISKKTVITNDTLEMLEKTFNQFTNYIQNQNGDKHHDYVSVSDLLNGLQYQLKNNLEQEDEFKEKSTKSRIKPKRKQSKGETIWEVKEDDISSADRRQETVQKNKAQEILTNILANGNQQGNTWKKQKRKLSKAENTKVANDESSSSDCKNKVLHKNGKNQAQELFSNLLTKGKSKGHAWRKSINFDSSSGDEGSS